jgi:hypothetical protein
LWWYIRRKFQWSVRFLEKDIRVFYVLILIERILAISEQRILFY